MNRHSTMLSSASPSASPSRRQSCSTSTSSSSAHLKMPALSLPLLHILVLLLSMGAFDAGPKAVSAVPFRRDSQAGLEHAGLEDRGKKPRIGMSTEERSQHSSPLASSSSSTSNFPDLTWNGFQGHSVPLEKLETRSSLHPQMLLQHHMNRAHGKLEHMHRRQPPSQEDRKRALLRRRDLILEDQALRRRRSLTDERSQSDTESVAASVSSSDDAAKFVPDKHAHGRFGISINPKTGKAGKAANERRELDARDVEFVTATVVETVTADGGSSEEASEQTPTTVSHVAKETIIDMAASKATAKRSSHHSSSTKSKFHHKSSSSTSSPSTKKTSTTKKQALDASKTSSYNIAALGFPTADVSASNSVGLNYADHPDTVGSLGLNIEANDIGYIAIFDIGTAGPFRLLIDSGSADTWVASTLCSNCSSAHKPLGSTVSKTFANIVPEKAFEITYGTGHVEGHIANDTLNIGSYVLKDHTMGLALSESDDFSGDTVPFDGLMGLAQSILSSTEKPTPIDSLYSQNQVKEPAMGYHLGRAGDVNNNGQVTFGGVDGTRFKGNLTEMKSISNEGFWEVVLDSVWFNNTEIKLSGDVQRSAILDTGTTLIVAPQADAEALHQAIPGAKSDGAGGYTIPCTTSAQVEFGFGNQRWPIDARDMLFLPLDGNDLKGDCISAVSAGSVGSEGEWLVGAAFLKNVYFATNTKSNSVGLGVLTPNTNTTKAYTSNTAKYQKNYP